MPLYRYRKLKPTHAHYPSTQDYGELSPAIDVAGATYDVESNENQADENTLVAMLRGRELMPSDLVHTRGIWQTFSEAPEFYEACEGLSDRRAQKMKLRAIVFGIAVAIGVMATVLYPIFLK